MKQKIKSFKWELRVTRSGFLQSKGIINEAEIQEIKLTKSVNIKYDNIFWVQDFNLYDDEKTKSFSADKNGINHIFIEGDNYHALSVLNYTHNKKIDLILKDINIGIK